jgi:phosphate starvation-inducible protein PhoH and related proteins
VARKKDKDSLERYEFKPKTDGQSDIVESIYNNEITIVAGPAGSGKSFVSLAVGLDMLLRDRKRFRIEKIMIVRPAVSSEKIGFLPGSEAEKLAPYMRPMYDNMRKIVSKPVMDKLVSEKVIEECTLGYMRGMSIDNTLIILDEAQNTTEEQMLMFLSRIGYNSKMVVNGDTDQVDLNRNQRSGLKTVMKILKDVRGIGIVELGEEDIVRNPIIKEISKRFNEYKNNVKEYYKDSHVKSDYVDPMKVDMHKIPDDEWKHIV